jgi:hypothetical protein
VTAGQNVNFGVSSPGGGGSGGSFLVQSGRDVSIAGGIDTGGGQGSRNAFIGISAFAINGQAGNGAPGFFRLESNGAVAFGGTSTPAFNQAQNVGPLSDRDGLSGDTSRWRGAGFVFPPTWDRYELDVDTDGDGTIDVTFTDGGTNPMLAWEMNGPVTLPLIIEFQGAKLNQAGNESLPGTEGPWRTHIGVGQGPLPAGIGEDGATGFRFRTIYNRAMFPNMVVSELRVFGQS